MLLKTGFFLEQLKITKCEACLFVALLVLIENEAMYYFSIVVLLYTLYFLVNNVLPISLWIGCGYVVGKAKAWFIRIAKVSNTYFSVAIPI